jgi:hypothetical protein
MKKDVKVEDIETQKYVDKWTAIGLSTAPLDKERIPAAINKVYECGGIKPPKQVLYAQSPAQANRMHWELQGSKGEFKHETDHICYGNHDAEWLSFYDCLRNEVDLKDETEKLAGLTEAAELLGWFIPTEDYCIVCERPSEIHLNEDGRLHNVDGPALSYSDGFCLYRVSGVRVPKWFVEEKERITADAINSEDNVELRRAMIDIFGPDKYLLSAGELVCKDEWGALYRKEVEGDEDILMVHVIDSTPLPSGEGKKYMLRVPPNEGIETPKAAVAWLSYETEDTYNPLIET